MSERQIDCYLIDVDQYEAIMQSNLADCAGEREWRRSRPMAEKRRKEYLLGRVLLRYALCRYLPDLAMTDIEVEDQEGLPPLVTVAGQNGLAFGISHSHGLVAVAVSRHGAIGVDIEYALRQRQFLAGAKQFCAPTELEAISQTVDEDEIRRLYYLFWTRKEACLKLGQLGIGAIPLAQISFEPYRSESKSGYCSADNQQVITVCGSYGQFQLAFAARLLPRVELHQIVCNPIGSTAGLSVQRSISVLTNQYAMRLLDKQGV